MIRVNLAPGAAMTAIRCPVEYAERLDACRNRRHRHLLRFVSLMLIEGESLLRSEKAALISRVASLVGCLPEHVLMDIDTVAERRAAVESEMALEAITGMVGPDPMGDDDDDEGF